MSDETPSNEPAADENPKPSAFSSPYAFPPLEWMLSNGADDRGENYDDNGNDPEAMEMARRAFHDIAVLYLRLVVRRSAIQRAAARACGHEARSGDRLRPS